MSGIFGAIAGAFEAKASSVTTMGRIEEIWADVMGGHRSNAGAVISPLVALQCATVLACARRIAEALMVPVKVYQRPRGSDRRLERPEHQLYRLLEVAPNDWQSGLEYRETIGLHLALTFNHYSFINRIGGRISELIPLDPSTVQPVVKEDMTMVYRVKMGSRGIVEFASDEIWHIRGPSWLGSVGMDAIKLMRESIGLALASEENHARLQANGGQPGGILTTEKRLDTVARERLKSSWAANQASLAKKYGIAVLDDGLKWQQMAMTGVDAQHLQVRQMQVEQICQAMCVMPIMVGYSGDKAPTYASSEQLFLAHLVHTARPWHDRIASSVQRWLFTPEEVDLGYYVAFKEEAFLSPAMKDRAEYYKIALGGGGNPGWMKPNEVRGHFEADPVPGGDKLYVPTNIGPAGSDGVAITAKPAAAGNSGDQQ